MTSPIFVGIDVAKAQVDVAVRPRGEQWTSPRTRRASRLWSAGFQLPWRQPAAAVRASSVVENWHSVLRPHLAVHRALSPGLLALLAVYHNHRVAPRGVHQGTSPLQRCGLDAPADRLTAVGYPPPAAPPPRHTSTRSGSPMAA